MMVFSIWVFQFSELSTKTPSNFSQVEICIADALVFIFGNICLDHRLLLCRRDEHGCFCSCTDILFLKPQFTVLLPSRFRSVAMLSSDNPLFVRVASS